MFSFCGLHMCWRCPSAPASHGQNSVPICHAQVDPDVLQGLALHAKQMRPLLGMAERHAVRAAISAIGKLQVQAQATRKGKQREAAQIAV